MIHCIIHCFDVNVLFSFDLSDVLILLGTTLNKVSKETSKIVSEREALWLMI